MARKTSYGKPCYQTYQNTQNSLKSGLVFDANFEHPRQKAFFFSSILLAAYSYGLGLLKEDENHPQLDDYSDKENKNIEKLEEMVSSITSEQKDKEEVAL